MVQLQMLSYILNNKSMSILFDNNITDEYFTEYSGEYEFIKKHYEEYKKVPDVETFLSNFEEFELLDVKENERYLVDTIREEYLYSKSVPVIKKAAELLKGDANEASKYLQSELVNLVPNYTTPTVNIIQSNDRVKVFEEKSLHKDKWFIPTGFRELDDIITGWQMGEEYVVIFARTGQGKSWFLVKSMQHAWQIGKNVGYISPEMSANKIGYRFDTVNKNFSNLALLKGDTQQITVGDYSKYCEELAKHENKFLVSTPMDFNKQVTVSKLRTFITFNKLDVLAIDGITYMTDERYKRGDNKTTTLTNISEDLMALSCELKVPILIVVQSNREGVKDDKDATPSLENIRDSDGISHNASKVIALKQKEDALVVKIEKHRDGRAGDKLTYLWDIDSGIFQHIPTDDDFGSGTEKAKQEKEDIKKQFPTKGKVVF